MKNTTKSAFLGLLLLMVTVMTLSSCGTFICNPVSGSGTGTGSSVIPGPVNHGGNGTTPAQAHPLLNPATTTTPATCSSTTTTTGSCSSTDTPTQVMYSVNSTGAIVAYGVDSPTTLTLICPTATAAVGELVVSNNKFLYVLDEASTSPSILGFIIGHGNTGTVTTNGQSFTFGTAGEVLDDRTNIEADPSGHLLFVTNFTEGKIHVFLINQGAGTLTEAANSPFLTVSDPAFLAVSSNGLFAYVTDPDNAQIHVFNLNSTTGAMAETTDSPFVDDGGLAQPGQFIAIHPNGNFLYTADSTQISAYTINTTSGDLGGVPGSPFDAPPSMIPNTFVFDSTGVFLYVIDFNDPGVGVGGFLLDNTGTGALLGQVPGSPFALSITQSIVSDPTGGAVFVLGGNTTGGLINIFTITAGTGALTPPASATLTASANLVISNVQ
jgi:6-phosphogluconolactonase (cycloisomerase 2 family)